MCHKIRAALIEPEEKLGGIVEVDETYVGGKDDNRHGIRSSGERGGTARQDGRHRRGQAQGQRHRARDRARTNTARLTASCSEAVSNKVSLLATDEHAGYRRLGGRSRTHSHHASARQYVVGAVHTNTIEGFWSIFKRGIVGTFHKVSHKYLPLYVAEFQFRYNNRQNPDIFGAAIAGC